MGTNYACLQLASSNKMPKGTTEIFSFPGCVLSVDLDFNYCSRSLHKILRLSVCCFESSKLEAIVVNYSVFKLKKMEIRR